MAINSKAYAERKFKLSILFLFGCSLKHFMNKQGWLPVWFISKISVYLFPVGIVSVTELKNF